VNETDESVEGVKITDKRRIDPVTGQLRVTSAEPVPEPSEAEAESQIDDVAALLAERTADLQRLQAEYTNYRRRVDRDRDGVRDAAAGAVLSALLPVLDDIDRARAHDEFDGAFRTVGEAVEAIFGRLGVERFGVEGEPFDPTIHEALTHEERDDVEVATITA
jgi:molecular chaperone GrpE